MPLLKRWLSFSPLYAVSTIYLWLLATTPFTRTQALKADRLRAKKPYRIHHKSYYTIWYFCEWAHCIRNSRVPRGTLYRKWTKRKKPLIYKGFRVVVTVGLEPTTPSMWTMCSTDWAMPPRFVLSAYQFSWTFGPVRPTDWAMPPRLCTVRIPVQLDIWNSSPYRLSHATTRLMFRPQGTHHVVCLQRKHKILWFWIMKTCQIPQESVGLTGRGKLLSTTTKGEKHKTKMTKL